MSKDSPLKMNMDLVRGAAKVAKAEGEGKLAASKAFTAMGEHLSEGISKVVQKRNKEFNKIMKTQLGKEGLSDEEWQKLYKRFRKRRAGYVYLNKKERMDFERNLIEEAEDKKKNDADREEIAEKITDDDNEINAEDIDNDTIEDIVTGKIEPTKDENGRVAYALDNDALQEFVFEDETGTNRLKSYKGAWEDERFTVSEDGKYKTDKFGNKYTNDDAGYKEFQRNAKLYWIREAEKNGEKVLNINSQTGEREYLTPDEARALLEDKKKMVTIDEIKEHIDSRAKDTNAANAVTTLIASGSEEAKNLKEGDSLEFDRDKARTNIGKALDNTDLYKAATKNMVGNTSFKQDLTEKLISMKYGDLGISDDVVKQLDPTPDDGKVSQADANVIVNKILDNKEMLKGYLTDYFMIYQEREFKNNIPSNLKGDSPSTVEVNGGSVGDDGVWVPGPSSTQDAENKVWLAGPGRKV